MELRHLNNILLLGTLCLCVHLSNANSFMEIEVADFENYTNLANRIEKHRTANYLLMPHIYRAFLNAGSKPQFLSNYTVAEECVNSLQKYYEGLLKKQAWAWKMYDATGKQMSGIFLGATTWTGNYEECLDHFMTYKGILGPVQSPQTITDRGPVRPQYCSVFMTHAPWMPRLIETFTEAEHLPFDVPFSPFIVDVCVPKKCSEADIREIVDAFLSTDHNGDNITTTSVRCHTRSSIVNDIPALLSACFLLWIFVMVVLGTSYDIYRRRQKLRIKRGPEITIGYDEETDRYGILKILLTPSDIELLYGKRKGRRGTLSSSEHVENVLKRENRQNGWSSHMVPPARFRTQSETLHDHSHRPHYMRMQSAPVPKTYVDLERAPTPMIHVDLENIPEEKDQGETVPLTEMGAGGELAILPELKEDLPDEDDGDDTTSQSSQILSASNTDGAASTIPNSPNPSSEQESSFKRKPSLIEVRPSHRHKKITHSGNLFVDLLLSFSFRKNTRHILADGSPDTLFCLNGVRVLSIAWIVLGNVYGIIYQNPEVVENHVSAVKMTQSLWTQMVINTTLAADSFFVLSGALGAYHFLKIKTKEGKQKETNWTKVMSLREYGFMIVHRLVRIFPCYAVLLLLGTNLMPYLGEGPRWSHEIEGVKMCKRNWWSNALFINNFYNPDDMCLPHTYYLANDFQFFLMSPLILIPLLIMPKLGLSLIGFFVVAQIVIVSSLNQGINGNVLRMKVNDYWSLIYVKPYSRIGVYAIGLGLGYFLFTCDRQMKFRQIPLYVGWFTTIALVLILPYVTFLENREGGAQWSGIETALYEAFSRPVWALALSWVIFTCSTAQGAFVGKFLSWNVFLPLCRITYGVFLLHPVLIAVVIESSHYNFYLNFRQLMYTFIPLFACSYALAFLLIACVECPFTSFESCIRLKYKKWKDDRAMHKIRSM